MRTAIAITLSSLVLHACSLESAPDAAVIAERYVTAAAPALNIDSVATHAMDDGSAWLFATAKEGNVVRIFDAATGALVRDLGGPGGEPGQFSRPNGIAARDGLLVVVERDNRRVQIFEIGRAHV